MSDGPKIYRNEMRVSRKEHVCCECSSLIGRSEIYHVFTGLWDNWGRFKTCDSCNCIRNKIDMERSRHDDPLCFGGLVEAILDSDNQEMLVKFVDNMISHDNIPPEWILDRITSKNKRCQMGLKMLVR
jgi:hypothetical protein